MPRSAPTQTAAELAAENAALRAQLKEQEEVAFYCWARLVDYDGYYNPQTRKGDVEGLARITLYKIGALIAIYHINRRFREIHSH